MTTQSDTHTSRTQYNSVTVTATATVTTRDADALRGHADLSYSISPCSPANTGKPVSEITETVHIERGVVTQEQAQLLAVQHALEHAIQLGVTSVTLVCNEPSVLPGTGMTESEQSEQTAYEQTVRDLYDQIPNVTIEPA